MGHRHDVWDVHASDGRWWVITNPTNLYSQAQFPNMDLAVTFHTGLCLRIPRTQRQRSSDRNIKPFEASSRRCRRYLRRCPRPTVADYQAVGMRSREALLAFAKAANEVIEWDSGTPPTLDKFLDWNEVCQSARKRVPGPACKKDPRGASFCSVQRRHPSVPAHASDEPSRGAAVKNGRFISGRPQGLFLRAVSTAA